MKKPWILAACAAVMMCVGAALAPLVEKVDTPLGKVTVSYSPKVSAKSVDLPFYPGARVTGGSECLVKTEEGELAQVRAQATLTTKAPAKKVAEFYGKALKGGQSTFKKDEGKTVLWKGESGKVWIVTVAQQAGKPTSVEIRYSAKYKEVDAEYPDGQEPRRVPPPGPPQAPEAT